MLEEEDKYECPTCGALVDAYAANCYNCGCEFDWEDEEQEEEF